MSGVYSSRPADVSCDCVHDASHGVGQLQSFKVLAMLKPEATTRMAQVVEALLSIAQELLCTLLVHDLHYCMGGLAVTPQHCLRKVF